MIPISQLKRSASFALLLAVAPAASAQSVELTPFVAYRFGNTLRNGTIDGGEAFGVALRVPTRRPGYAFEAYYSRQSTDAIVQFLGVERQFGVTGSYLGLGSSREMAFAPRWRSSVGVHATWSRLASNAGSIDRLGASLGLGTKYALTPALSINTGWRLFSTFVNTSSGVGCGLGTGGAGCSIGFSGSSFLQSEFSAGFSIGFASMTQRGRSSSAGAGTRGAATSVQPAIRGTEWVLQDMAGTPLITGSQVTLSFADADRITGNGSCNRYSGVGVLEANGRVTMKRSGSIAMTRMACAPELMAQEDRYLALIDKANRVVLDGASLLVYTDAAPAPLRYQRKP
jgi:heat shock protein HslJ